MLYQIQYYGVSPQELINSTRIYPIEGYGKYNYSLKINIGTLKSLSLPHSFRLCYDNFLEYMTNNSGKGLYKKVQNEIVSDASKTATNGESGQDRVVGSVGKWYAGYALPITTIAVEKGIPESQAIEAIAKKDKTMILTDGYILVTFDIKSKNNLNGYLKYYGPEARFKTGPKTSEEILEEDNVVGIDLSKPEIDWREPDIHSLEIILPNGRPARVPNGVVSMFEAGISTQVDNTMDIIY